MAEGRSQPRDPQVRDIGSQRSVGRLLAAMQERERMGA